MREEVRNWLNQAEYDLSAAKDSFKTGHFEWACFQSQQAAEKALKALYVHSIKRNIVTHDIVKIAEALDAPAEVKKLCRLINSDYTVTRYPDAANGIPAEQFDEDKANEHMNAAESILKWVKNFLK